MNISIVVALNYENIIGINNLLPWHMPEDLINFKKITLNKPIIMGRKTFESIGQVLPKRKNIVVSQNNNFKPDNVFVYNSIDYAIKDNASYPEICIIGGSEIFKATFNIVNKIYLTIVNKNVLINPQDVVTYFPQKIDFNQWNIINQYELNHQCTFYELEQK